MLLKVVSAENSLAFMYVTWTTIYHHAHHCREYCNVISGDVATVAHSALRGACTLKTTPGRSSLKAVWNFTMTDVTGQIMNTYYVLRQIMNTYGTYCAE